MNSSEGEAPQSTDAGNVHCASFLSDLVAADWRTSTRGIECARRGLSSCRVQAALLEHFACEDVVELSSCYEEILKKDPTCCHSVARLLTMHQGDYHPGSILEMLSLHLDATYAEHQIWKEFATCFLKLARHEEDCMSVHLDGKEGGFRQTYSVRLNRIPDHFLKDGLGKNWRFWCRWWLTRHFSYSILETQIAAGNIQLLTYKAACAAHMCGQEFEYVVKVYNILEEGTNEDLFLFLRTHLRNSVRLQSSFQLKPA